VLEQRLGDHGSVYHAIHVEQRRSVAVKLLDTLSAPNDRAVQEFARELLFLQTLQHPNVVPCYGGGVHELQPYLAMELVRGQSLDVRLRREGPMAWPMAMAVARQLSAALVYADTRNVMHLRLAPSKILLGDDGVMRGVAKIVDFRRPRGLIGIPAVEPQEQLVALAYSAPEQICGKPPVSPSTDVYALGCILYEMLVGRPPFLARSPRELAHLQLTADPPRLALAVPDCPVWLDALVAQLLEKDPQRRPSSASDVAVALEEAQHKATTGASVVEHALSGSPTAIRPKQADQAARELLPAPKKPKPQGPFYERVWFLSACLAVLILVVAWVLWPASDQELLAKAQELMSVEDHDAWDVARRDYLLPLLAREPADEIAQEARAMLDRIEIAQAEQRLEKRRRSPLFSGGLSSEEKRFIQAKQYEDFGDAATALALYDKLLESLTNEADRPLAKLVQRQARELRGRIAAPSLPAEFLERKLAEAERLVMDGDAPGARTIWYQIRELYQGQEHVQEQWRRAMERLALGADKPDEKTPSRADPML